MNNVTTTNDLNKISDDKKKAMEEARRQKLMKANANFSHGSSSYSDSRSKNTHIEIDDEVETPTPRNFSRPMSGQHELSLDQIIPYEHQVRKAFDADKLKELAQDITKRGVQTPIKVFRTTNGRYAVYNGERRFRASHMAGLKTIPAIITSEADALVDSFQDNEKRENLNILSRALYFQLLLDRSICSGPQEIAELLSISDKSVYEGLSYVSKIPKEEFDRLIQIPDLGRADIRSIIKAQNSNDKPSKTTSSSKITLKVSFDGPKAKILGMEQLSSEQIDALASEITNYIQ